MAELKLVVDNVHADPKSLAFEANELYVHIATKLSDSQFKENMLEHISQERSALIQQVIEMYKGNENDAQ